MKRDELTRRDLCKTAAMATVGVGVGLASPKAVAESLHLAQEGAKVPTTELGRTGKQIPILLMGCSQNFVHSYDKLLHRAYKKGVYYLDGGQLYGNGQTQKAMGTFVEQIGREKLWITSKVMLFGKNATPDNYRRNFDKMMPDLGEAFLTNRRRPIVTIVEDTSPGVHDTLNAACDIYRYQILGCAD